MKHEIIEKNAGLLGVLVGSAAHWHWHVPVDRWADSGAPGREPRLLQARGPVLGP